MISVVAIISPNPDKPEPNHRGTEGIEGIEKK
jgi:hypothetical protein